MKTLFVALQYLLPKALLTAVAGRIADSRIPWLKNLLIRASIRAFGIDLSELEHPAPKAYASFNEFFARPLRRGARPVCLRPDCLVSPVDGTVSALGKVREGRLFQAKGRDYDLVTLLGGDAALAARYANGHFITLYLSPRDYHRVHWPRTATLNSTCYVPGALFSVNPATVEQVPALFARNERLVIDAGTETGPLAIVMVGAMIVAGISTVWHPAAYGRGQLQRESQFTASGYEAGAELGRFTMGSTVILLVAGAAVDWEARLAPGAGVRMGEALAQLRPDQRGS